MTSIHVSEIDSNAFLDKLQAFSDNLTSDERVMLASMLDSNFLEYTSEELDQEQLTTVVGGVRKFRIPSKFNFNPKLYNKDYFSKLGSKTGLMSW